MRLLAHGSAVCTRPVPLQDPSLREQLRGMLDIETAVLMGELEALAAEVRSLSAGVGAAGETLSQVHGAVLRIEAGLKEGAVSIILDEKH